MFYYVVNFELTGIESLRKSDVNAALKGAWEAVGKRWRRRYLPLHFTNRAERRYYYTPRSWDYERKKLKFLNHTRPLEFTGEARREATYRESLVVTRDKCVVRLPRKFNLRHSRSPIRMADEIRRVLPQEQYELTEFFLSVLEHELRRRGARDARVVTPSALPAAA